MTSYSQAHIKTYKSQAINTPSPFKMTCTKTHLFTSVLLAGWYKYTEAENNQTISQQYRLFCNQKFFLFLFFLSMCVVFCLRQVSHCSSVKCSTQKSFCLSLRKLIRRSHCHHAWLFAISLLICVCICMWLYMHGGQRTIPGTVPCFYLVRQRVSYPPLPILG